MNEVYLSGRIVSVSEPGTPASHPRQLVYQLRVTHKNARQQVKRETYTVNAWGGMALWAAGNIRPGMEVVVRGYLSQRMTDAGPVTEVAALHMIPVTVQYVNAGVKPMSNADEQTAVSLTTKEVGASAQTSGSHCLSLATHNQHWALCPGMTEKGENK